MTRAICGSTRSRCRRRATTRCWYASPPSGSAAPICTGSTKAPSAMSCLTQPLVLGHEFVGVIETGERTDERVALDPAIPCGRCAPVHRRRREPLCRVPVCRATRSTVRLRSQLAWPGRLAHRLPDSLPDAEASLLEPLGVALHALDLGRVQAGMTAGVYGCGPIGLLLVQLLRRAGVDVLVATDPLPHRIVAAEALGATVAVETRRAARRSCLRRPQVASTSPSRWPARTTRSRPQSTRCDRAAGSFSSAFRRTTARASPRRPRAARDSRSRSAAG